MNIPVHILYRPIGPGEFAIIVKFGYRKFPPRMPYQPIFNPVTNEEYACDLVQSWSVNESTSGYVTSFAAREDFIAKYPALQVDVWGHTEHWIPAEDLPAFNRNIVGLIDVIASFER